MEKEIVAVFETFWSGLPQIEFKTSWKNGTGYLDYVTSEDLGLSVGEFVGTTDDFNRKVIIKCVAPGYNHALFQRTYSEPHIIVSNEPHRKSGVETLLGYASNLSTGTLKVFLGLKEHNIVFYPERYKEVFKGIEITQEIMDKVEKEIPFTLTELNSLGVDVHNGFFNLSVKDLNV